MWWKILLGAVALLIVSGGIFMFAYTFKIAKKLYNDKFVRTDKSKWAHTYSFPDDEEQCRMFDAGVEWANAHKSHARTVETANDGLKLVGEYYDFGADRCVVIFPGRCETYHYSYYFAETYTDQKCNILLIDQRGHGYSDGDHTTFGAGESRDALEWARYAHEELGNREVMFHGICMGASTAFIAAGGDSPDYITAVISEGCYTTFLETLIQHTICENRPVFPVVYELEYLIKKRTGTDIRRLSPICCVPNFKKRALFLCGEEDLFSLPARSVELYEKCGGDKRLVWLPKGRHAHLRINNREAYDSAIREFINV